MNSIKLTILWMLYLLRGSLGKRRFFGLTPPLANVQRIYDRVNRVWLKFKIRDGDDWIQIEHIFLNEEFDLTPTARVASIDRLYEKIINAGQQPLVVDLGANIGLASSYFDLIYPAAAIIAVEPDKGNCEIARENLPPHAVLVQAAVSSSTGSANLVDTGRNCGFRVETASGGDIKLVTVPELLELAENRTPFLIKIDIEGFEEDLFSTNVDWIDKFPILLIELHDWMLPGRRVTRNFLTEIASRDREFMHFDGYIVSMANLSAS